MTLTKEQHEQVVFYLQHLDIDSQELFEEFYDHIISSYEHARKTCPERSLREHIWKYLQPEFGGVDGFKSVIRKHKKLIHRAVTKRIFFIALSYFRWPMAAYGVCIFLLLWTISEFTQSPTFVYVITSIGLLVPYTIVLFNQRKFRKQIKLSQPGFYSNSRNDVIAQVAVFSAVSTYYLWFFGGNFKNGSVPESLFDNLPLLPALLMWFSVLYAATLLKVIKEDFKTQLSLP